MRVKTVTLDDETRAVFLKSRIEGTCLYLADQLPREVYLRVAKAIKAAGGQWNRQAGCHVFPADVRQTLNIAADTVQVVNVQQTYQSFYTPDEIARQMVRYLGLPGKAWPRILEPSAGDGRLIEAAGQYVDWQADFVAVELNEQAASGLLKRYAGTKASVLVIQGDFMAQNGDLGDFDRILMNPPFTRGQDVAHIKRALSYLKPGGRLVALCADGPKQRDELKPHATLWESMPPGTFKESGTGVNVALLVMERPEAKPALVIPPPPRRQATTAASVVQFEFAL